MLPRKVTRLRSAITIAASFSMYRMEHRHFAGSITEFKIRWKRYVTKAREIVGRKQDWRTEIVPQLARR
jgi:hypothetical protein